MRLRKKKHDNTEIVSLLRSVVAHLERIEQEVTRKRKPELLPAEIFDDDNPPNRKAAIT